MSTKKPAKKVPAKKKGKNELVVAPGGRRRKSQIHEVKPSEAVERKEDGSYVVTKRGGAPSARAPRPLDPEALVLTPGGYKRRAQVHRIESGHILDGNQGRFRMIDPFTRKAVDLGEVVVRKQLEPLMPLHVRRKTALRATSAAAAGGPTPALGEGWITYAGWNNGTGQPISFFTTTWVVPPPPARRSGQTIFLFNGIQNASMIYQPVLQWGPSAAGGGENWAVACWYADGQDGQSFHSPLVNVNPGNVLVGNMALTGRQAATLGDTSPESPALASLGGRLYLAWKGDGNNNLNVMSSTDNGATFGNKHTSPERSPDAPSLCVHNGILFIAWKGDGNNNLNVARVGVSGNAITGFTNKVTLGDTSPKTPSLASIGGRLYLAWRGDGNTHLNVMSSGDNGATFGNKHTSPERSTEGPALCAHSGLLFIAWKGDGNNNLNVARVGLAGNAITGITNKVVLGDTSPEAPSLASAGGRLCLGWKGDGNNNLNVAQVMFQNGRIVGLFGAGTNMFSYDSQFVGIGGSRLAIRNVQELTWANETLEAYDVQEQLNYPATLRTQMRSIEIRTLGGNPALNWTANNAITDTGQHTVIVSNANPGGEVDLYYYGSALVHKTTLGDTSSRTPPIASLGGRMYIAWNGEGNNKLNVMSSGDNGVTFGNKHTSGETSPEAPSLCVHNGILFIAWKGTGNDKLNVARVGLSGNVITGLTNKVTLGDTSPATPALASAGGRLYLGWRGKGNTNLNVMSSGDNGATFGNKHTSPERSTDGPALCAHAGMLMIAWKGDGNDKLNVARVGLAGSAITGITNKVVLGDTSPLSPALASFAGRLWLGWKGNGNDFLNVMSSADGGATFGNKHTSWETSPRGPGLAAHAGLLFVSWNGVGNDQLNVAQLGS